MDERRRRFENVRSHGIGCATANFIAADVRKGEGVRGIRMIFHILVTVFFFGFALLLGILNVMRGLYAFSIFQPPVIPSDSAAMVSLDDGDERATSLLPR
jgi:hypothetical protein